MTQYLPPMKITTEFLSSLLGRDIKLSKERPSPPSPQAPVSVATFTAPSGTVSAICVFDVALANFAGAAFSMIPAGVAKEHARKGQISENIQENLDEIYNISARLFDNPGTPDLRFEQSYPVQGRIPAELGALVKSTSSRMDLKVEIKGYGAGNMSIFRTKQAA